VERQVDIRVMPKNVILPPNRVTALFVFSPTTVTAFQGVNFDASGTTDNGVPCGANCTYNWTFGDGGSSSGRTTTHEFRAAGSYLVTLTASNINGQTASASQTVTVGAGTVPTAAFTFSPTAPRTSQDIFFSAEGSRAASGRRIVAYDWNFGSGRTGSGVTVSKRYDTAGSYVVTLTVTDDAFQATTVTQSVTVVP
jgi:PKD repeat protein